MKQQIAVSLAGLMLLTSGYESVSGKALLSGFAANVQSAKTKKTTPTPQDLGEKNMHDQWQGKSSPNLYDGGFFIRGDFLYWRADEEGLQYGASIKSHSPPEKNSLHMHSPTIQWDPGFRIGVGYTFSRQDYWDLTALWTHFQTHQSAEKSFKNFNISTLVGETLIPWWGATFLGSFANKVSAHWNLKYNIYDLGLGRNYFVAKTLSVHPFIGFRGATIDQRYRARYRALLNNGATLPTSFKASNDFWGIGAHLGTTLQWYCTSSFSLIGSASGSLLYADFKTHETYAKVTDFINTITVPFVMSEHLKTGVANLEAMLGIQWETFLYQKKWKLAFSLGYEWAQWYSQNRLTRENLVTSVTASLPSQTIFDHENGNLTLQGATFLARLDF